MTAMGVILSLLFLSYSTLQAQTSEPANSQNPGVVYFLNGRKVESLHLDRMERASVSIKKTCMLPGSSCQVVFIQTYAFIHYQRPEFFISLPKWIKDPNKSFVVNDQPLLKRKRLLRINEKDIDGFSITRDGSKEKIEIFLSSTNLFDSDKKSN